MKTTRKDRYEHKLRQFRKELDSWDGSGAGLDSYVAFRTEVMKKYGFTDVDWERAIGLTLSKSERHYYCDGIGIKKDVQNKKDKAARKLERDLMSGKQQFYDEDGEATIKVEDACIADVYEPNLYDDQYLAKD
jgi:hypothetical protein